MSAEHPFSSEQVEQLKMFITLCKQIPSLISHPDLTFFKDYIESVGGKVPEPSGGSSAKSSGPKPDSTPEPPPKYQEVEESSDESEVELDNTGVIEDPDMSAPDSYPPVIEEISEEAINNSDEKKQEAMQAVADGDKERAISLYSEAIKLNPGSAVLFAKRGQLYLQLKKLNACVKDCTHALELNPDSAAAYKFRGRAHRLLGNWEEAAHDLRSAAKIDFDEQVDEWLREVTPNARKLEEHRRKYERKLANKELRERQERARKARAEHERARQQQAPDDDDDERANRSGMDDFYKLFQDPEIAAALKDPEVEAAFVDISSNPANLWKYQSNPKIANLMAKLSTKFPGGMPGMGGMGGFPGFAGAGSDAPNPGKPPSDFDDAGLD